MNKENDDVVVARQQTVMTHIQIPISLRKIFSDYLKLKFNRNEDAINVNEQKELESLFQLGLIQAKRSLYSKESTLLINGKKPRDDEWKRLGWIAFEFSNCNCLSKIPSSELSKFLNKALGNMCDRSIIKYRKIVLENCNFDEQTIDKCKDSRLGEIDVTFFISQIPKQYITSSSTSSFIEGDLDNEL